MEHAKRRHEPSSVGHLTDNRRVRRVDLVEVGTYGTVRLCYGEHMALPATGAHEDLLARGNLCCRVLRRRLVGKSDR